jgi:hypothetical protein
MADLLREIDGQGKEAYLVARGRAAAERLQSTGMYSQLSAGRERWGDRLGAMMASIGPAMFKDSSWSYAQGQEDLVFRIEVRVTKDFPEAGRLAAQGFIAYLTDRAQPGAGVEVQSRLVSDIELEYLGLRP